MFWLPCAIGRGLVRPGGVWFRIAGPGGTHDKFGISWKGARPGETLADLIFNWTYSLLIRDLLDELHGEGIQTSLPYKGDGIFMNPNEVEQSEATLDGTAFFDDLVLTLLDACPEQLLTNLAKAAEILQRVALQYGLRVNWGPGKTEAIVQLRSLCCQQ